MRPVPDFKLVPHVGPEVEVISEIRLGNTVVLLVQVVPFISPRSGPNYGLSRAYGPALTCC